MSELLPCMGCGEKHQLEVQIVDRTDPSRDKIKCRHCKTTAYRVRWNNHSLSALQAAAAKMGMAVVPVEPTEAMIEKAMDIEPLWRQDIKIIYKAMIKAVQEK